VVVVVVVVVFIWQKIFYASNSNKNKCNLYYFIEWNKKNLKEFVVFDFDFDFLNEKMSIKLFFAWWRVGLAKLVHHL